MIKLLHAQIKDNETATKCFICHDVIAKGDPEIAVEIKVADKIQTIGMCSLCFERHVKEQLDLFQQIAEQLRTLINKRLN